MVTQFQAAGGDVWRDGNYTAPTYAAYAAQAYLRNSNALTVVRLLGGQSSQVADGGAGASWRNKFLALIMLIPPPMVALMVCFSFSIGLGC